MNNNKLFYSTLAVFIIGGMFFAFLAFYSKPNIDKTDINSVTNLNSNNDVLDYNIETLVEGTGEASVENGNSVTVHYTGTLTDGTVFDSSIERGEPMTFVLGQGNVIKGWDLGLIGMKVGEKRKLTIPPSLAYGDEDIPGIPGGSTLIFEVDLLSIN